MLLYSQGGAHWADKVLVNKKFKFQFLCRIFTAFYQVQCTLLCIEKDTEIFPAHYTWKVAEKVFKMAFMMNKLAMINFLKLFLKNKYNSFAKNHREIQVHAILICTLYSIKCGIFLLSQCPLKNCHYRYHKLSSKFVI